MRRLKHWLKMFLGWKYWRKIDWRRWPSKPYREAVGLDHTISCTALTCSAPLDSGYRLESSTESMLKIQYSTWMTDGNYSCQRGHRLTGTGTRIWERVSSLLERHQ